MSEILFFFLDQQIYMVFFLLAATGLFFYYEANFECTFKLSEDTCIGQVILLYHEFIGKLRND